MDTLCGQAYGAENFAFIGLIAQRAFVISLILASIVTLAWTQIKTPLVILGQSSGLAGMATKYLLWCAPELPLTALATILEKFQISQVCYAFPPKH
jgi:multidrug resistance protein, MATE family